MIGSTRALVGLAAVLAFARVAAAQEPAPEPVPAAEEAAPAPARSKPRPKPKPKPVPKAAVPTDPAAPEVRPGAAAQSQATPPPEPVPHPVTPAVTPRSATPFAAPVVACEPGKAVRYDEAKAGDLWVTRAGTVSVDNPLRPLTPDVTRVLQVVVGNKLATAYGPDLTALRRGASPGVLEGVLGGPIRWDAALGALPETLTLVSEVGARLAEMRFRDCGDAPAVKAPPAARKPRGEGELAKGPAKEPAKASPAARRAAPAPVTKTPPGFTLPQGAIP